MFDYFYLFKKFLPGRGFLFIPWDITGSSRARLYLLNGYMVTGCLRSSINYGHCHFNTAPALERGRVCLTEHMLLSSCVIAVTLLSAGSMLRQLPLSHIYLLTPAGQTPT